MRKILFYNKFIKCLYMFRAQQCSKHVEAFSKLIIKQDFVHVQAFNKLIIKQDFVHVQAFNKLI